MKIRASVSGLALGLMLGTLASCQKTPPADPVDVDAMISLLPEGLAASYDSVDYDKKSGHTKVSNFRLTSSDNADFGVVMEELVVSGFDQAFLQARMDGTNFSDTAVLFDYLQAKNTSLFGVEEYYGGLSDAYIDALGDAAAELTEDSDVFVEAFEAEKPSEQIEKLEFKIANMEVDDLLILPFEPPAKTINEAGEEVESDLAPLQNFFAMNRAIGAKSTMMSGLVFEMDMITEGQPADIRVTVEETTTTGWKGGDVAKSTSTGLAYEMTAPFPQEDDVQLTADSFDFSGGVASYEVTNMRLDEAYSWLVKGELPPASDTDVLSLGTWTASGEKYSMFGADFYSVSNYEIDMSEFHWLIPTKVDFKFNDMKYDFGALLEQVATLIPEGEGDAEMAQALAMMDLFEPFGITAPVLDMNLSWRWDAEKGPGQLGMEFIMDGYGRLAMEMNASVADFATLHAAFSEAAEGGPNPRELLTATSSLSNISIEMEDFGGVDKLMEMTIEFAKTQPDDPNLAGLANFQPEGLKGMLTGMIALGAPQAAAEFPEVQAYSMALINYINDGGKLRVAIDPETPLDAATMAGLQALDGPSAMVEQLAFTVEHTPPSGK